MIGAAVIRLLAAVLLVIWPMAALGQEQADPSEDASDAPVTVAETPAGVDFTAFERLAQRAEDLATNENASPFALSRLRAELVVWRDILLDASQSNAARIATVAAQIDALGPVPEDGEEPQEVTERREDLIAQRNDLIAPRLLANEAHARVEGLIREFDMLSLRSGTEELTQRGPSPLNLVALQQAVGAVVGLFGIVATELSVGISAGLAGGTLMDDLPRALGLFVIGAALLTIGRRTVTDWRARLASSYGRWSPLFRLIVSFAQIVVPLIGLSAVAEAIQMLEVFGLRGNDIVGAIPLAGFWAIFGWWLSRLLFPLGLHGGYLFYDADVRTRGRRYVKAIGWVSAVAILLEAGLRTVELSEAAYAATELPFLVLLGVLLWRLGVVIKTPPMPAHEGEVVQPGGMRLVIGRYSTVVAILSPLVAALGYRFAGSGLMSASLLSLGLVGVLFLVQRNMQDLLESPLAEEDNRGLYALLPVFVSFVLFMVSAPLFALIWGTSVDDLLELWVRFREGFAIGETRLSPTDFLMFAFVFAFGYLLTRFIQGLLRNSVLPRTRLDLGAQNAVVAGLGYVGIILAGIFAITSAGLDLSNLAIVAGALSVGIGFGLQNIVSNFVSGIILLIERPVSQGDWIEVGGQMGIVREISVRSTRIRTFDRRDVIIPNADLVSGQVTNWTRGDLAGRIIIPVGVAYGSDVERVTEILGEISAAHPALEQVPPPMVLFQGFGADALEFEIRGILTDVNHILTARSDLNYAIDRRFREAGIEIPFAQRDIWLRNAEVLERGKADE